MVVELLKKHLGQGTTEFGVASGAKLIQEQQAVAARTVEEPLHPVEPVAVCGELVLDALVVPDVGQDLFEQAEGAVGVHREPGAHSGPWPASRPTILRVMDLPPALGPLMISILRP